MADLLSLILAAILWASFLHQLGALHQRPHSAAHKRNCLALGLFSLTMTLLIPPLYLAVDRWTGVPNISRLLANCLGVASAWAISPIRERVLDRPRRRDLLGSTWLFLLTVAALAGLFAVAPVGASEPGNFAARYGSSPAVVAYRLVLMAYVGAVMGQLCYAGWRHRAPTRTLGQRWLRLRSQLQTVGWGCGAAYAAHEAIYPVAKYFGVALPAPVHTAIEHVLLSAFVLFLLGGGFISLGHFAVLYRAYRRLYPLWRDLYQRVPSIAAASSYPPPHSWLGDVLATDDLELRVHGRVMGLEDGLVALRPYAAPASVARARLLCARAGIAGERADAIVDATILAAALRLPQAGWYPEPDGAGPAGSADPDRERRYFERVARAYRHSPIVRASVRAGGDALPPPPARGMANEVGR